ncbi:hypothetical protein AKJ18_07440 [Vibrio xuii]|nr:hypothetical protein AKJ18_07440 [Vibrio xuii]
MNIGKSSGMDNATTSEIEQRGLCSVHKSINVNVREFIKHVPKVNEESITDYLFWKWAETDSKLKVFEYKGHDKKTEGGISGADLEIFFLTSKTTSRKPLVIQSKKLFEEYNSYARNALCYRDGSGHQMKMLEGYSGQDKTPCYMFYAKLEVTSKAKMPACELCDDPEELKDFAVFITPLDRIKDYAEKTEQDKYKRVSRSQLIEECIPFHKLFCPDNRTYYDLLNLIKSISTSDGSSGGSGGGSSRNKDLPRNDDKGPSGGFPLPEYVTKLQNGVSIEEVRNEYFKETNMPKRIVIVESVIDDDNSNSSNVISKGLSPGGIEKKLTDSERVTKVKSPAKSSAKNRELVSSC